MSDDKKEDLCVCEHCDCEDCDCGCQRKKPRVLRRFVMRGSQLVEVGTTVLRETRG